MHWYYFYATTHKICSIMTLDENNAIEMILTYSGTLETGHIMSSLARETNHKLPANWIFA